MTVKGLCFVSVDKRYQNKTANWQRKKEKFNQELNMKQWKRVCVDCQLTIDIHHWSITDQLANNHQIARARALTTKPLTNQCLIKLTVSSDN